MQKTILLTSLSALLLLLASCKKQDTFSLQSEISDYYPLKIGKYITYQLDSTIYINFGNRDTVISYQAQDRIDCSITDNTGRPAYLIHRFLRKDDTKPWVPDNTFMAVSTAKSLELVENNLRFIKLKLPVSEGFSWKGNSFLTANPYPSYDFASSFTQDWDYTYDSIDVPLSLGNQNIDSALVISHESLGQDPQNPSTVYAERTYAVEKYARGIGLVYKEFLHWEYQGQAQKGFKGFGIKLTMINHN